GSYIKAFPPYELFDRIVRLASDNQLDVYSQYFGRPNAVPYSVSEYGCGSRQLLTNGFYIRMFGDGITETPVGQCGIPEDIEDAGNRDMFMSLMRLFENMDAINCLGMGLDVNPV